MDVKSFVAGLAIGSIFGWLILYVLATLLGIATVGIGYAFVYVVPTVIVATILYVFVKHHRERSEFRAWKKSQGERKS